jgi:hypothetical protein
MKIENFKFINKISRNLPSFAGTTFKEQAIDAIKSQNSSRLRERGINECTWDNSLIPSFVL